MNLLVVCAFITLIYNLPCDGKPGGSTWHIYHISPSSLMTARVRIELLVKYTIFRWPYFLPFQMGYWIPIFKQFFYWIWTWDAPDSEMLGGVLFMLGSHPREAWQFSQLPNRKSSIKIRPLLQTANCFEAVKQGSKKILKVVIATIRWQSITYKKASRVSCTKTLSTDYLSAFEVSPALRKTVIF